MLYNPTIRDTSDFLLDSVKLTLDSSSSSSVLLCIFSLYPGRATWPLLLCCVYLVEAPVEDALHLTFVERDLLDLAALVLVVEGHGLAGG